MDHQRRVPQWRLVCTLIAYWSLSVAECQTRNLCDMCECFPDGQKPIRVDCDCKINKILILKEEHAETLQHAQTLNMSSCSFFSFPRNGFPTAKKLTTMEIHRMKLFHLNSGIFPELRSLLVEDLAEFIIDNFEGHERLSNIEIRNTMISEIGENTFEPLNHLERVTFEKVTIGTITTKGFTIAGDTKPIIRFVNCKIDEILTGGMTVEASKFELINTTIGSTEAGAVTVNATNRVEMVGCDFGRMSSPASYTLNSHVVYIGQNVFASLPSDFLQRATTSESSKIHFVGNLISDVDLGAFVLNTKLEKLIFRDNRITCDCTPRKTSVLKLKDLFPGILADDSYFDAIIAENRCDNYEGVALSQFKNKLLAGQICDNSTTVGNNTETPLLKNGTENAGAGAEWTASNENNKSIENFVQSWASMESFNFIIYSATFIIIWLR